MATDTLSTVANVAEILAQIGASFFPGGTPIFNAIVALAKVEPEAAALFQSLLNTGNIPTAGQLADLGAAVAARKAAEAQAAVIDAQIKASQA